MALSCHVCCIFLSMFYKGLTFSLQPNLCIIELRFLLLLLSLPSQLPVVFFQLGRQNICPTRLLIQHYKQAGKQYCWSEAVGTPFFPLPSGKVVHDHNAPGLHQPAEQNSEVIFASGSLTWLHKAHYILNQRTECHTKATTEDERPLLPYCTAP